MTQDFGDAYQWRKSTHSGEQGGSCVYTGRTGPSAVGIRDGKAGTAGAVVSISTADWSAFITAVKADRFTN